MTTLAIGASATASRLDGGSFAISTNGGFGSIVITPVVGSVVTETFGPLPYRKIHGPYSEGASAVISNVSCNALDYDVIGSGVGDGVGSRQSVTGSGATAIDLSLGPNIRLTVAAATTVSFTNTPASGYAQRVVLNIINGSAFALTWPTTRWAGSGGAVGSAPTLQAAGEDKVVLDISNTGGVIYDGSYVGRVA